MKLANTVRDVGLTRRAMPWSARLRCWLFSMLLAIAPGCLLAQVNELPLFAGSLKALAGDVSWYDRDSGGWIGTSTKNSGGHTWSNAPLSNMSKKVVPNL